MENELKRVLTIIGSMLLALAPAIPAMAADYDLVILNDRVMDPEKNFVMIMKDGKIYKNTVK